MDILSIGFLWTNFFEMEEMCMKKRVLSMALCLCLLLALLPTAALTAEDTDVLTEWLVKNTLKVAGVEVTSANASNIQGQGITGMVSFDIVDGKPTLTLEDASIFADGTEGITYAAPEEGSDTLYIVTEGTNGIAATSSGIDGITVVNGSLDISGGTLTVDGESNGIIVSGELTIHDCILNANGQDGGLVVGENLTIYGEETMVSAEIRDSWPGWPNVDLQDCITLVKPINARIEEFSPGCLKIMDENGNLIRDGIVVFKSLKYRISQQPTTNNGYTVIVQENKGSNAAPDWQNATDAAYQWYVVESTTEPAQGEATYGTYANGIGTADVDNFHLGYGLSVSLSVQAGDLVTITSDDIILRDAFKIACGISDTDLSEDGKVVTIVINYEPVHILAILARQTFTCNITVTHTTLGAAVEGQTKSTLTASQAGSYACMVTTPDGTQLTSNAVDYVPSNVKTEVEVSTTSPTISTTESKDEAFSIKTFTDIIDSSWYHEGVRYCIEAGLMDGLGNGIFAPKATLSRGMLAQILYKAARQPSVSENGTFNDVTSNAWYANAVTWANENGIIYGYENGTFCPDIPVTREQFAAMLWRYAGSPASTASLNIFTDSTNIGAWAVDGLRWAVEQGIIAGKGDGTLDPHSTATRAEAAAMLQRYMMLIDKK